MPILTTPPKLLDSGLNLATGEIFAKATSPFSYEGDEVTATTARGFVVAGVFCLNADGTGDFVLPVTPVNVAIILVTILDEFRNGRPVQISRTRVVSVPEGATVTWDTLVDVVPEQVASNFTVPTWVATLQAGVTAAGNATEAIILASATVQTLVKATDVSNSALLIAGPTVAIGGDSVTEGSGSTNATVDSYVAYLGKSVGTARASILNHGVGGETAAGLLARMPAIIAANPAAFLMMIGTNPSADLAAYKVAVVAILDLLLAARIPVIVCTLPPRGTVASSHLERTNVYNMYLRYITTLRGLPLVDTFAPLVDATTGLYQAAYDFDGTHPTPAGHLVIANAIRPILEALLPTRVPYVAAVGAPGLVANPLMAGGSGSTPPTGWTSAGVTGTGTVTHSTVAPVVGDGLTSGLWYNIAIDATGFTTTTATRYYGLSPIPAQNDVILITAKTKSPLASASQYQVQWTNGSTLIGNVATSLGVVNPGMIARTYVVGASVSAPRIRFSLTAPAGTAHNASIGEATAFNLTTMTLLELV